VCIVVVMPTYRGSGYCPNAGVELQNAGVKELLYVVQLVGWFLERVRITIMVHGDALQKGAVAVARVVPS
jgi:hypothetical protein